LKQQVKALKKKVPSTSKLDSGKAGGEEDKNYIPLAVIDAVCKEDSKNAGRTRKTVKMLAEQSPGC